MSFSAFVANIQELDHYNNDEGEHRPHIKLKTGLEIVYSLNWNILMLLFK